MRVANFPQQFDQLQVAAELRLLKAGIVAAPIVLRKLGNAFPGHRAGEQARNHGRVIDDANVVLLAIRENFLFHAAVQHGVRRLQ